MKTKNQQLEILFNYFCVIPPNNNTTKFSHCWSQWIALLFSSSSSSWRRFGVFTDEFKVLRPWFGTELSPVTKFRLGETVQMKQFVACAQSMRLRASAENQIIFRKQRCSGSTRCHGNSSRPFDPHDVWVWVWRTISALQRTVLIYQTSAAQRYCIQRSKIRCSGANL